MPAPEIIKKLVDQFTQNRDSYRSGKYNEAQLRQEFLDPFFEALGWDVYNKNGYSLDYREVVIEDSLDIEGTSKSPDYAFKIGKERKFYVEAKKPKVDIQYDIHPAYQLRRYAWNAHLPLSILTDFEELAVYNCKNRPNPQDSAATGRELFIKFTEFVDRWDELAAIFSKEAVLKGAFDRYAESSSGKKGTTEVDDAFLEDIESWRKSLAQNIALRNPQGMDERRLNFAVQMTIDRIIFLRICEDRGIEPDEQLKDLAKAPNIYPRLVELFKRADQKYNSGLFHFAAEKGNDSPADTFTPGLIIDDKIFKDIFKGIYYPCEYIFKEIPVEILGQVYEQFLGKVIHLTAGHQARIEEKPEVRKAGGVYYTPRYIVDYIVSNTVGKLLEGKTPAEAAALKIVDPACGSGSFLLGAYQYLLDWHEKWYLENDPEKWAKMKEPPISQVVGGWRLTTQKKKEILVNNIHGVDIDAQAVEVTKLSLLLKVLEGETGQLSLGFERVLPDLGHNIQCGNSLIGEDYFAGRLVVEDEERRRVNPFDWPTAFPQVFARGGFDAVIGNPPYIRMEEFKEDKDYLRKIYRSHDERSDIYIYFIEKMQYVLKKLGIFGMIVSNKFLRANYGAPIREFLRSYVSIDKIIDFSGLPVFSGATVRTIILLTSKNDQSKNIEYSAPFSLDVFEKINSKVISVDEAVKETHYFVDVNTLDNHSWNFSESDKAEVFSKIKNYGISLQEYCNGQIFMGIKSGCIEAFVINEAKMNEILENDPKSKEIIFPYLNGREIRRYKINYGKNYLIYTFHGIKISSYPVIEEHLKKFKTKLRNRATKQEWYELQQPQFSYYRYFNGEKIIFPDISTTTRFALDESGYFGSNTTYFIPGRDLFLLGLLNSKIGQFYFKSVCAGLEGKNETYLRFFGQYLAGFPVAKPENKKQFIVLVERMLELNKRTPATPQEQLELQRNIAATDRQIDALVYQLYDLTPEEIAIVEGEN
ncbi:MAG: TaqI-like C-terminal specificity domain-containing protein [Anaerolineaceae bacterium]|nr:TaqI-like C-terminal specificity domain-containing protein [Anaerolineaceae bacterium]